MYTNNGNHARRSHEGCYQCDNHQPVQGLTIYSHIYLKQALLAACAQKRTRVLAADFTEANNFLKAQTIFFIDVMAIFVFNSSVEMTTFVTRKTLV